MEPGERVLIPFYVKESEDHVFLAGFVSVLICVKVVLLR
jgi:hypothetical protein